jgi:hypothetical protein
LTHYIHCITSPYDLCTTRPAWRYTYTLQLYSIHNLQETIAQSSALYAWPRSFFAVVLLGVALPNPHPSSRSWATMAPAQLPDLKPQHPEAQSLSLVQAPVMNCFPAPLPAPFPAPLLAEAAAFTTETRVIGVAGA